MNIERVVLLRSTWFRPTHSKDSAEQEHNSRTHFTILKQEFKTF